MKAASKKRSDSQVTRPAEVPVMTPSSSKRKHRDGPQPSHTSERKSPSPAPSSKKRRRSPLPSSPERLLPTPPTDVPATTPSDRKPRVPHSSSSENHGRASLPPPSSPVPGKPTRPSAEVEVAVPPSIPPPPSDDQKEEKAGIPKLFQRVWKNDDEITLLNGMLQFKRRLGKEPVSSEDFDALYESVKDSLELKVSRDQMMTKRLSLRRKFKGKMAKLQMGKKLSGDMHEQRCLELARLLWGDECPKDEIDKKRKGRSGGKPKEALQRLVADDSDDILVRLAEEVCCPNGVLLKERMMNFKPEKSRAVKESYIRELQMEKELSEQHAKLEAHIIQAMKAIGNNDDFFSSDDDDDDASDS